MDMSNYFYSVVSFQHVESFVLLFILIIYNKKSCLSICGEKTTYSTAACDISRERQLNSLL